MKRPQVLLGLLLAALLVAGVLSRFASTNPDGLNRVATDHGFSDSERAQPALLGEYGSLTGILGTLVVLALMAGLVWLVRSRRHRDG